MMLYLNSLLIFYLFCCPLSSVVIHDALSPHASTSSRIVMEEKAHSLTKVKIILFDLTGTLLTDGLADAIKTMNQVFGIDPDKIREWLQRSEKAVGFRLGSVSAEEYWSYVLTQLKEVIQEPSAITKESEQFFSLNETQQKEQLRQWLYGAYKEIPGVARLLTNLSAKGYHVAIFTNMEPERKEYLQAHFTFLGPVRMITSADVGFRKPAPEAFRKVSEILKSEFEVTSPDEILYVDDEDKNLQPVREFLEWQILHANQKVALPDSPEMHELIHLGELRMQNKQSDSVETQNLKTVEEQLIFAL